MPFDWHWTVLCGHPGYAMMMVMMMVMLVMVVLMMVVMMVMIQFQALICCILMYRLTLMWLITKLQIMLPKSTESAVHLGVSWNMFVVCLYDY